MSLRSALKELSEQVARLITENRRLREQLEARGAHSGQRSATVDTSRADNGESLFLDGDTDVTAGPVDRERVKAKLKEMLAELADI